MKAILLNPNQIITLNDYPIYSDKDLLRYLSMCKNGDKLPLVPVIKKDIVKKYFDDELLKKFNLFEKNHPEAVYFMIDGTHRTTALTLLDRKIEVVVYESDEDILEAKELLSTGRISDNATLFYSLVKNCEILNKHFNTRNGFMTVKQKTDKMVTEKVLPKEILLKYK